MFHLSVWMSLSTIFAQPHSSSVTLSQPLVTDSDKSSQAHCLGIRNMVLDLKGGEPAPAEEISRYEALRRERIAANRQLLVDLGLASALEGLQVLKVRSCHVEDLNVWHLTCVWTCHTADGERDSGRGTPDTKKAKGSSACRRCASTSFQADQWRGESSS